MYVYRGLLCFSAQLLAPIAADSGAIMLRSDFETQLLGILAGGKHTYLTLKAGGLGCEVVKVIAGYNTISIERGVDGTTPKPWPAGTCVEWELVPAAVAEISLQAAACAVECISATIASGATLPAGVTGVAYSHTIKLSGTPPFALGIASVPSWMTVDVDGGEIRLGGIPFAAGLYNVSIPVKSCGVTAPLLTTCVTVAPAP